MLKVEYGFEGVPESQRPQLARILYLSFVEYYQLFDLSQETIGESLQPLIGQGFHEETQGLVAYAPNGEVVGALAYYPTEELQSRQWNTCRQLLKGVERDRQAALMAALKEHAGGVPTLLNQGYYISRVAVAESARRQGVGRALMTALLERCRQEGVASVQLHTRCDNLNGQAYFQSFGFAQEAAPKEDAHYLGLNLTV